MHLFSRVFGRAAALTALLAMVAVPATYADDPPSPYQPPEARIAPPGGVSSQGRIGTPGGAPTPDDPTTEARIGSPGGKADARISPPTGEPEPSFFDLLIEWLRAQARIHPPIE